PRLSSSKRRAFPESSHSAVPRNPPSCHLVRFCGSYRPPRLSPLPYRPSTYLAVGWQFGWQDTMAWRRSGSTPGRPAWQQGLRPVLSQMRGVVSHHGTSSPNSSFNEGRARPTLSCLGFTLSDMNLVPFLLVLTQALSQNSSPFTLIVPL